MTKYDFYLLNKGNIMQFIKAQPNLVSLKMLGNLKISCEFDHTPEEEIQFKQEIANTLFQSNDNSINTTNNILSNLDIIQTDALIYTTELAVTKTNIGTSFVDLFTDYAGRNRFIDLTGYDKIRYHINANFIAVSGTQNLRIVDNATQQVVLLDVVITNGQNVGNVTIPTEFINFRGRVRVQVKSTQAADNIRYDMIVLHALRRTRT